jgi:hypothetical protein
VGAPDPGLSDSRGGSEGGRMRGCGAGKVSGTSTDSCEGLKTLLQLLRQGDTLVATSIDRLTRSTCDPAEHRAPISEDDAGFFSQKSRAEAPQLPAQHLGATSGSGAGEAGGAS